MERRLARGLILEADQGALFLDEIGHMPVALQARPCAFLASLTFEPLDRRPKKKLMFRW